MRQVCHEACGNPRCHAWFGPGTWTAKVLLFLALAQVLRWSGAAGMVTLVEKAAVLGKEAAVDPAVVPDMAGGVVGGCGGLALGRWAGGGGGLTPGFNGSNHGGG